MEVVIASSPEAAALVATDAIQLVWESSPRPVLGLATGSSPPRRTLRGGRDER